MILVAGATGSNGTEIVKRLAAQNVQVREMVRDLPTYLPVDAANS